MDFINMFINNIFRLMNGTLFENFKLGFQHITVIFIIFSFLFSVCVKYFLKFDIKGLLLFIESSIMFLISAFINYNIYLYIINYSSLSIEKDLLLTIVIISTLILMEIFYEISLKMISYTIYYFRYLFSFLSKTARSYN